MVDDKACHNDQDAKTGQPVRQVEFKTVEADNAESRQENPKSETRADPGGKTSVVAGDHGEPVTTGRTNERVGLLGWSACQLRMALAFHCYGTLGWRRG